MERLLLRYHPDLAVNGMAIWTGIQTRTYQVKDHCSSAILFILHTSNIYRPAKSPASCGRLPHFRAISRSPATSLKSPAFLLCRLTKF